MTTRGRSRGIRITRSTSSLGSRVVKADETEISNESAEARELTTTNHSADARATAASSFSKTIVADYGSDEDDNTRERTDRTKSEKGPVPKKLPSNDLRNFIPSGKRRKESLTASDQTQGDDRKINGIEHDNDNFDDDEPDDTMSIHAGDDSFLNEAGEKESTSSRKSSRSPFPPSDAKKRKMATTLSKSAETPQNRARNARRSQPSSRTTRMSHPQGALRPLPARSDNRPGVLGPPPGEGDANPQLQILLNNLLGGLAPLPAVQSPIRDILSPDLVAGLNSNQELLHHTDGDHGRKGDRRVCKFILQSLPCRFGDSCHFLHPATEAKNAQLGGGEGVWKAPDVITPVQRKRSLSGVVEKPNVLTSLRNQFDIFVKNNDIVEAWKVLKKALIISPSDVQPKFLEELLINCSTAATRDTIDVCKEVFEAIGQQRKQYVVEDYVCLIKCFCRATQYESALQAALHLKKTKGHVSKDLVDLFSYKTLANPASILEFWNEMKAHWLSDGRFLNHLLGLGQDLDLILEYVPPSEWWAAYEKLGKVFNDLYPDCQGKFLYLLMNIPDKEVFVDLLDRIDFADVITLPVIKAIIEGASSPKTVMLIIKMTPKLPTTIVQQLDSKVWNGLLMKCCDGDLEHAMFAQQVHGMMGTFKVPLTLEGATHLLLLLCKTKMYTSLRDLLPEIRFNLCEFPKELIQHISILLRTFDSSDLEEQYKQVVALLKIGDSVPDALLASAIKGMMEKKEFSLIVKILQQFQGQAIGNQPSYLLLSSVLKLLEYNCDDVQHSIDVYALMRRTYPHEVPTRSDASTDTSDLSGVVAIPAVIPAAKSLVVTSVVEPAPVQSLSARTMFKSTNMCRFVLSGLVCKFGSNCRFSHVLQPPAAEPAITTHLEQQPSLPRNSNTMADRRASKSPQHQTANDDNRTLSVSSKKPVSLKEDELVELTKEQLEHIAAIKRCGYERPLEDLARIHLQMRFNAIPLINSSVLKAFVFALSYMSKLADNFELYLSTLNFAIANMTPSRRNPSELELESVLDASDLVVVGHIGILLMQYCYLHKKYHDGYRILHSLHAHEVNYCELGREYQMSMQTLSHCDIAVIATTICVNVKPAQLVGALEVLRGANFALPADGHTLTAEESADRHDVFQKLVGLLMKNEKFDEAFEVLEKAGESPSYLSDFKVFYAELLSRFSATEDIQKATEIYRFMEQNKLAVDAEPLKALINGLAKAGRTAYARQLYYTACDRGVYQSSYADHDPLLVNIVGPHTKTELLFLFERHLNRLRKHPSFGENSFHGNMWHSNRSGALRVAFKPPLANTKADLMEVITGDLNPPLTISSVDHQTIVIDLMSVKRWYLAVPPYIHVAPAPAVSVSLPTKSTVNGVPEFKSPTTLPPAVMSTSSEYRPPPMKSSPVFTTATMPPQSPRRYQGGSTPGQDRTGFSSSHQPITLAITNRVTFYVKMGKVEPEGFQELCKMLTRYFFRTEQNCNPDLIFGPMVEERANIFVDNFFKKHKTFKKEFKDERSHSWN